MQGQYNYGLGAASPNGNSSEGVVFDEPLESSIFELIFYIAIPCIAILFIYASIIAYRTFGEFTFDSGVLIVCSVINVVAIFTHLFCWHKISLINQELQASLMTIMLYFIVKITNKHTGHGLGFGSLVCSFNVLVLTAIFVDTCIETKNF